MMRMNGNGYKKNQGFVLIELVLVIAIIAVLAGITVPLAQTLQTKNDLELTANGLARTLGRARTLAQAVASDTLWGIYIGTSTYTLFQGTSYATRVTSSDELLDIPPDVSATGTVEFVFSKLYGELTTSSVVTLTTPTNDSRILRINVKGVVSN